MKYGFNKDQLNIFKKQSYPVGFVDPNFQTPWQVCLLMADMVPDGSKTILEPTPGLGNLVKALQSKGYNVTAAEDFFLIDPESRYDCVVMNPPFSSKTAFLQNAPENFSEHGLRLGYYMLTEAMKLSDNIIALMPWFTVSDSDIRLRFLKSFGIKSLTALPRKTFKYARIQTVVIELEKGFSGETVFKVFDFKVPQ